MKKRHRLARQRDFQRVLGGPRLHAGRYLVAFAAPREGGGFRIGVAVSKKLRGAVVRNRAKRRLREVARRLLASPDSGAEEAGIGYDVVVIARPAALTAPLAGLEAEAGGFFRLLRERIAAGRA